MLDSLLAKITFLIELINLKINSSNVEAVVNKPNISLISSYIIIFDVLFNSK